MDGTCTFSDCPYGYGVKINNGINISLIGLISEYTSGIEISGNDNRNIALYSVYEENITGGNFVTLTGSGYGLSILGCFGVGLTLPYSANWSNVMIDGNAGISENGMYGNGRILTLDGGEYVVASAGDVTASFVSIPPGTWLIEGVVATEDAGNGALNILAARLTTTSTDSASSSATNSNFVLDIDRVQATAVKARSRVSRIYQNTSGSPQVMYLRAYIGLTAGAVAYRGYITAAKLA